jgi:hypothetical protein
VGVHLDLPKDLFSALRRSPDEFVREMRVVAAIHWYQRGQVSQEALAAGAGRVECLVLPHRYDHLSPLVDAVGLPSREAYRGPRRTGHTRKVTKPLG